MLGCIIIFAVRRIYTQVVHPASQSKGLVLSHQCFSVPSSLFQTDKSAWGDQSGQITEESSLYCEVIRIPNPMMSLGAWSYLTCTNS